MGSGWTSKGIARYNAIFESVAEDRKQRGRTFNNDLLEFYNKQLENHSFDAKVSLAFKIQLIISSWLILNFSKPKFSFSLAYKI